MRQLIASASAALLLTACGPAGQPSAPVQIEDSLAPGQWQVSAVMGQPGRPTKPQPPMAATRCLQPTKQSTQAVILELLSRERCQPDRARIARGHIDGVLRCPGTTGISEHDERIAGRYSRDSLDATVDMKLFGIDMRQTITARRVGEC